MQYPETEPGVQHCSLCLLHPVRSRQVQQRSNRIGLREQLHHSNMLHCTACSPTLLSICYSMQILGNLHLDMKQSYRSPAGVAGCTYVQTNTQLRLYYWQCHSQPDNGTFRCWGHACLSTRAFHMLGQKSVLYGNFPALSKGSTSTCTAHA